MLHRKLLRDLWRLRAQALAIALLIASGVALFCMSVSNYLTLRALQEAHYTNERFGDIFAELKRAPETTATRIGEIDGVAAVETRIVHNVRVDRPDSDLPVAGRLVSIPSHGQPELNRLRLVQGRWVDPSHPNEVIINVAYANAQRVRLGDTIEVILNGRREAFVVVGTALSPEFVFTSRSNLPLPEDRSFVVLWASRQTIERAFDMDGAFNDVVIRVTPGANPSAVIAAMDRLLEPYGGLGAISRRDQPSHRMVEDELTEQKTLSIVAPLIFLAVAGFLLNVVLARLVEAQREQIATLKALGYPTRPILFHYLQFAAVTTAGGIAIGGAGGALLGALVIEAYRPFFQFPDFVFDFRPSLVLIAGALAFAAAAAGAYQAVWRTVSLPAAIAMRAGPVMSRAGAPGRALSVLRLSPANAMALRGIAARPIRALMTVAGLALATPLIAMGLFWWDALDYMVKLNFDRIERADTTTALTHAVSSRAVAELRNIPGVTAAEGYRNVSARLRNGHRTYRTALQGLPPHAELKAPREANLERIAIPSEGLVLSRRLADRLGVGVGGRVDIEILEGERATRQMSVTGLADDVLGLNAYIALSELNRLMREGELVNAVAMTTDPDERESVWRKLRSYPNIESVTAKSSLIDVFNEKIAGLVIVSALILTAFGSLIAVGIVYNAARVTFQERAWELASLRILGFTRSGTARILFTELGLLVLLAMPLGLVLSRWFITLVVQSRDNDSFDIPPVLTSSTLALSSLVVAAAALGSALAVRRRIDRMDIVAALKARD